MQEELETKKKQLEQLKPEVEKAVLQKASAEEDAKACEALAEEIRELKEKKAGLEVFLGKVEEAKEKGAKIEEENQADKKLKQEKISLEQTLKENK